MMFKAYLISLYQWYKYECTFFSPKAGLPPGIKGLPLNPLVFYTQFNQRQNFINAAKEVRKRRAKPRLELDSANHVVMYTNGRRN